MPALYLHIPFCKQACHYCDFHFSTSLKNKQALLEALKKEIQMRFGEFSIVNRQLSTVYFGGGTPSLLTMEELSSLLEHLHHHFTITPDAEITLEANPDDLSAEKLRDLKSAGINRLSIGVQSFFNSDLRFMNRAHNAKQAQEAVQHALEAGFANISIDLIYGTPTLSNKHWEKNIEQALAFEPAHLSAYCLTVEKGTALARFIEKGKYPPMNEQQAAEQFQYLIQRMEKAGWLHYEISNFASNQQMVSRHNSSYWKGETYMGIGPSAHSYDGRNRRWNIANNTAYIRAVSSGQPFFQSEALTDADLYNEYIMTGLRTMWGCDLQRVPDEFRAHCLDEARTYLDSGHLARKGNVLTLTTKGKLMADRIASDLFAVREPA